MAATKLGVITFFGILVPGAYLTGVLVLAVASTAELCELQGHQQLIALLSHQTAIFAGVFLFVAYLVGVLVRLFAPEYVDKISRWYLVYLRRSNNAWVNDRFPYEQTITSRLEKDGMGRIPELMSMLNPAYGTPPRNTSFFNYCKWFIDANDAALSRQVHETEALVRFLSGTAMALLVALLVALVFVLAFAFQASRLNCALYVGLLAMDAISLALILQRFKYQRRREVIMVWSHIYLILNGGSPASIRGDIASIAKRVFFASDAAQDAGNCGGIRGNCGD